MIIIIIPAKIRILFQVVNIFSGLVGKILFLQSEYKIHIFKSRFFLSYKQIDTCCLNKKSMKKQENDVTNILTCVDKENMALSSWMQFCMNFMGRAFSSKTLVPL